MLEWVHKPVKPIAMAAYQHALDQQLRLAKPGSLGVLEEIVVRLCGMQNSNRPHLNRIQISIFAADHGIAAEEAVGFSQAATLAMLRDIASGGAAISVLAKYLGADLEMVDVGVCHNIVGVPGVVRARVAQGTANFRYGPAMTPAQLRAALLAGQRSVTRAVERGMRLFIAGDVGSANAMSATALACGLLNRSAREVESFGGDIDRASTVYKAAVVQCALDLHLSASNSHSPLDLLQSLGGFEIAAITGAYIAAAQQGLPVLVDGFVSSVAALLASRIHAGSSTWWFYGHTSAEPCHHHILKVLNAKPLLNLGVGLGEGSGAAMAVPLLRQACMLHAKMATVDRSVVAGY